MGNTQAREFANAVKEGQLDQRLALGWHLTANHYPPLPAILVSVAEKAIDLANEGEWDKSIKLPRGTQFRFQPSITVRDAVDVMHLGSFLEDEGWS